MDSIELKEKRNRRGSFLSALICGKREGDGEDERSGGGEDSGIETIDLDIVVATEVKKEVVDEDDDGGVSKTTEDEVNRSFGKID